MNRSRLHCLLGLAAASGLAACSPRPAAAPAAPALPLIIAHRGASGHAPENTLAAFRLAGAQSIVMSLWRVPDVQTREFMEKFYAALMENSDTRKAFSKAQQSMRKVYDNPYYWAGFVLLE